MGDAPLAIDTPVRVGVQPEQQQRVRIGLGCGLEINQIATPLRGIRPGQRDPVVGDRMQKRITALAVAIEEFEGIIEAAADGIYTRHFADRNLHHRICREHFVECVDSVAVQVMCIEGSEIANLFSIKQRFEFGIHNL